MLPSPTADPIAASIKPNLLFHCSLCFSILPLLKSYYPNPGWSSKKSPSPVFLPEDELNKVRVTTSVYQHFTMLTSQVLNITPCCYNGQNRNLLIRFSQVSIENEFESILYAPSQQKGVLCNILYNLLVSHFSD